MDFYEMTTCACGLPAEIVDRWVWRGTDGPVEHTATHCAAGHHYVAVG